LPEKASAKRIVEQLRPLGSDGYRNILLRHGVREPVFGVKIADLKKIHKPVKTDYQLALDLYDTGIYDAMYLAGLLADDQRMTAANLQHWVERANCPTLAEYTVAWVAAGSPHGPAQSLRWIDSSEERVASAGWATQSGLVTLTADAALDLQQVQGLLRRVQDSIHAQPNRVRYVMNGFVLAVGCYVAPLSDAALQTARRMGTVSVDMDGTACKLPDPAAKIEKARKAGTVGKKRKMIKC